MARYRKRPIEVEAKQWFPGRYVQGVRKETPDEAVLIVVDKTRFQQQSRAYVITIHGQRAYLDPGDWVIAESDGEHFYPCKPDEFARIYEPVG
jgi:hypothetical protein